jgi:hypothetical protein
LIWTATQLEARTDSFSNGGGKMMRTELMMLLAVIAVCTNSISTQATIPVAEVDQIITNPNQYNRNILALHGIAGTVALQSRTFTVLDFKSSKAGGTSARFVRVTFPDKSQLVIPAPGQEVVVVGKIVNRLSTVRSVALQVFTNPSDIQKILAQDSKTRSSGKPSGDLPERNTHQEPFDSPETVYRSCIDMQSFRQEVLRVILLDTRFRRITTVDITKGTVNESLAHPREIFRPAIIHSAYALVVVHNL